jgi:hypothetical protein
MLTRRIRVKGIRRMGAFGKVFPTPKPGMTMHGELIEI